jgi:thiol-disulfide isomerase/thioredoxin
MKNLMIIAALICSLAAKGQHRNKPTNTISIKVQFSTPIDSNRLSIAYWPKLSSSSTSDLCPKKHIVPYKTENNCFYFRFRAESETGYFSLIAEQGTHTRQLLFMYLLEPGDEITISLDPKKQLKEWEMIGADPYLQSQHTLKDLSARFSGEGSAKYQCRYGADSILYFGHSGSKISRFQQAKNLIDQYQNRIKASVYQTMLAGYTSRNALSKLRSIRLSGLNYASSNELKAKAKAAGQDILQQISSQSIPEQTILQSDSYAAFILAGLSFENIISGGRSDEQVYQRIKEHYKGELKDKLLTVFLLENLNTLENIGNLIADARRQVQDPFYKALLEKAAKTFSAGASAYDFSLPDKTGRIVRFSEYKDKIVYLDFWFTGCAGCSYFYQHELSKVQQKFKGNPKVVFMTISVDLNKAVWLKSLASNLYTSDQAINLYTQGMGSKHPLVSHYNIKSYPAGILLDRGKVFSVLQTTLKNADQLSHAITSLLR